MLVILLLNTAYLSEQIPLFWTDVLITDGTIHWSSANPNGCWNDTQIHITYWLQNHFSKKAFFVSNVCSSLDQHSIPMILIATKYVKNLQWTHHQYGNCEIKFKIPNTFCLNLYLQSLQKATSPKSISQFLQCSAADHFSTVQCSSITIPEAYTSLAQAAYYHIHCNLDLSFPDVLFTWNRGSISVVPYYIYHYCYGYPIAPLIFPDP
jgi:hypothetical protein